MIKRLCFFVVTVIMVLVAPAHGAVHYITPTGAGTNSGADWSNAYNSLPATLTRGDTYYFSDGTYSGQFILDDAVSGSTLIYLKKCYSGDAVCTAAAGYSASENDGQAIFSWTGGSGAGNVVTIKTSYYEIDGQTGGYPNWTSGHGFKVTTDNPKAALINITHNGNGTAVAGNIHIYRTELAHVGRAQNPNATGSYGPLAIQSKPTGGTASAGGHQFAYNYIHDSPVMLMWGYETGSFTLEYNYFDTSASLEPGSEVQGSGITTYASSSQIYRYNIFKDMKGSCGICLYTWHGDLQVNDVKIYGNVFFYSDAFVAEGNQVQNGIIASEACTTNCNGDRVSNVLVYNNTFVNMKGYKAFWISDGSATNYIRNNIIYQCKGVPLATGDFANFLHDNNWFYGNKDYRNDNPLDANWAGSDTNGQTGTGSPFAGTTGSTPYRISDPTNNGDDGIGSPYNVDLSGEIRQPGAWDRGAYQHLRRSSSRMSTGQAQFSGGQGRWQ